MNGKGLALIEKIRQEEAMQLPSVNQDPWRLQLHLMPPVGWLNDPNGLCQMNGVYHVFFQYSPFDAKGSDKFWGHYTSRNLREWEYCGTRLVTDEEFDRNGVYSGCSFVEDGNMYLFYTGNVKHPGDYDYILKGRGANVVLVESPDGAVFSEKELLLTNEDYPKECTCHVRDPKVFCKDGIYYMVLGARNKNDRGIVLLYESRDLKSWEFHSELKVPYAYGYMWECPDLFAIDGQWFLSVSPQGLPRGEYEFQNVYGSGYFTVDGDFRAGCRLKHFAEWDKGFDFYAPQTFVDESGRTILIGWAGLPDIEKEYQNPTVSRGWQHALTLPRVLTCKDGRLYQYPAEELGQLRGERLLIQEKSEMQPAGQKANGPVQLKAEVPAVFDLEISLKEQAQQLALQIGEDLHFTWDGKEARLFFTGASGCGRTMRKALLPKLHELRVIADTSIAEIYCNHGQVVFTTRYYPEGDSRSLLIEGGPAEVSCWEMKPMQVKW